MLSFLHDNDIRFAFQTANLLAQRSQATRARVGSVIWDIDRRTIIGIGYNGTETGTDNTVERDGVTVPGVIHAEENALRKLPWYRKYLGKHILFVTHSPCLGCAQRIIDHGNIHHVAYQHVYGSTDGLFLLKKYNIPVTRVLP